MGHDYEYSSAEIARMRREEAERKELADRGHQSVGVPGWSIGYSHAPCGSLVVSPDIHDKFCPARQ